MVLRQLRPGGTEAIAMQREMGDFEGLGAILHVMAHSVPLESRQGDVPRGEIWAFGAEPVWL